MNVSKTLKDTLIIICITLSIFVVFELGLRTAFPEKYKVDQGTNLAYRYDKDYLVELKPDMEKTFFKRTENGIENINWKTNSHAFRGEEMEGDPEIRIIVYGDSNVMARFSTHENTFPHRLEEYLEQDLGKNIEVLNAGVVGFGPDQSLLKFKKQVDIYKPDMVIFHIFADNDFGDIIRNRLFDLDPSGSLIETDHERTVDPRLIRKSGIKTFLSSLLLVKEGRRILKRTTGEKKKSADNNEADFIKAYSTTLAKEYENYKQSGPRHSSHFVDHYDFDIALFPNSESSEIKTKLMSAVIHEAKRLAEQKSVAFMVVIQPSIIDMTTNFKFSYKDLAHYPDYRTTTLTDKVEDICLTHHIPYLNLYSVFLKNSPQDLFFRISNNHWNDTGQNIAAKETSRYISSNILQDRAQHNH